VGAAEDHGIGAGLKKSAKTGQISQKISGIGRVRFHEI
jgi:hypothetical protein